MVGESAALYVHWPWCVRKCPYCDFNSHAMSNAADEAAYIEALTVDLKASLRLAGPRTVTSIFFGGGTPSLMSADGFARFMDTVRGCVRLSDDCEVTLEANPGTVEQTRFAAYAAAGVNRFSLGIQSFNDAFLSRLGRIHSGDEARRAVEAALKEVDNVNLDLMFALPGQSVEEAECDVRTALSFATTHLSFYELTIEEGTAFAKRVPEDLPDEDAVCDMTEAVHELTRDAGFEHYEVSGYARQGRRCRHNMTYWTFGDYLGIGAGAHGKISRDGEILRTVRRANPMLYTDDAVKELFDTQTRIVSRSQYPFEFMLNVLRLYDGVSVERWRETTGLGLDEISDTISDLRREGLLVADESRIAATDLGHRFLSDVQERFLAPED